MNAPSKPHPIGEVRRPSTPVPAPATAAGAAESARAMSDLQSGMMLAKAYPRDQNAALERIKAACRRPTFAENAIYSFPRGKETVSDLNIRAAEEIARCWGNLRFGMRELSVGDGSTEMAAFCYDLETNTVQERIFTVEHVRFTRDDGKKALYDPRDIYENNANHGARRMRACILAMIPADIQEAAVNEIRRTLAIADKTPLPERINKLVAAFASQGVSQQAIERRLKHAVSAMTEHELVDLQTIHKTIHDGVGQARDFFDLSVTASDLRQPKPAPAEAAASATTDGGDAPTTTEASVRARLEAAPSTDAVADLLDLARALPAEAQERLKVVAQARTQTLNEPPQSPRRRSGARDMG